ncbi:PEP-CTERM sorting domain-containing protein [Algisphaera agarilytica]|uniref:Ice-binding protein C-terminal domain-containing protein n=1 Tax=Algisphaera agarilytica TaxID=1385975 RepID=A0A7X0H3I4_9BACT|nr:PEP-CTERM sorting domain-containing protein [Algisphaera agarilytica]MBB6428618.1 hypothetical protein [Algisphaera agarilytica]
MGPKFSTRLALGMIACFAPLSASAAFVSPTSWSRGIGGTTYQEWDVFSTNSGATPDVGNVNGNGTASLTETVSGSFITSGGNIYHAGAASSFTVTTPEADVTAPAPDHNVTAIVQIRSQGTELDYSSVLLNGIAAVDTAELGRIALGGFGGELVDSWFLFNIPYAAFGDGIPGVEDLTLTFNATGAHMSLDRLSIDTAIQPFGFYAEPNPVPEPASLALLGLGAITMLTRRRA